MLGREPELRALREAFERVAYERSAAAGRRCSARPASGSRGWRASSARPLAERATVLRRPLPSLRRGHHVLAARRDRAPARRRSDLRAALEAALAGERARRRCSPTACCRPPGSRRRAPRARTSRGAVRDLFEALARARPVVLVFEDLHWAEPPLLDLVEHLLEHTRERPLMLLCLAREELIEQRPRLGARDRRLEHCSSSSRCRPDDTRALIDELLPADAAVGRRCASSWSTRAEGNPLFVEQMLALLRERTATRSSVSVPPTIQALLAARLDRLTVAERRAIGAASVIGREFWARGGGGALPDAATRRRTGACSQTLDAQAAGRAGAVDARGRDRLRLHATSWSATPPTSRSRRRTAPSCTSASRTGWSSATPSA